MSYVVGEISGDSLSAPHSSCIDVGEVDRFRIFHRDRLKLVAKRVGNGLQQRTMGRNRDIQPLRFAGSAYTRLFENPLHSLIRAGDYDLSWCVDVAYEHRMLFGAYSFNQLCNLRFIESNDRREAISN